MDSEDTKKERCDITDCKNYTEKEDTNCRALEDVDFGDEKCPFFKKKASYQVMPELSTDEVAELRADIMKRGVMVPVELDEDGNILDGFHRVQICEELGITDYPTIVRKGMTEEEKLLHARKLNMARRQLTQAQKREIICEQLIETPEQSNRQIASKLGVDHKTVGSVRLAGQRTGEIPRLEQTIGLDGKVRTTKPNKVPALTPQREVEAIELEEEEKWVDAVPPEAPKKPRKKKEYILHAPDPAEIEEEYDVVVVDPPWPMEDIPEDLDVLKLPANYDNMTVEEIKEFKIPAAKDCHVFIWTTDRFLKDALDVLEAWGADFMHIFIGHKSSGYKFPTHPTLNGEYCLYGRIGSARFLNDKSFVTVYDASDIKFHERPPEFYDMIKNATTGKRIDMFGHKKFDGFKAWPE